MVNQYFINIVAFTKSCLFSCDIKLFNQFWIKKPWNILNDFSCICYRFFKSWVIAAKCFLEKWRKNSCRKGLLFHFYIVWFCLCHFYGIYVLINDGHKLFNHICEKEFEKIALIFEHFEQQKTSNEKVRSEILIWRQ